MANRDGGRRGNPRRHALAVFALVVPLTGALLAALLAPWVVTPALAVRGSATLLTPLPVELTDRTPPGNTVVLASDGSLITQFFRNDRTPVGADRIADVVEQALVDIEDSRFYDHNGLDVQGTLRALARNVSSGGVREGGSTITQQLVKQTLLQSATTADERRAATEQTVGRKLKEARLALALEETYPKDEILTRYLNVVYFGAGAYGVQAAAQRYFGVDAADLDLPQAAMLAGLVQTPGADSPLIDPERAKARRDVVLRRMHALGHIDDRQLAEASAGPVVTAPAPPPPNGCAGAVLGGFFCDFLQQHLTGTLGITRTQLEEGGLTIRTTMRADLQRSGDAAVLAQVPADAPVAGMFTAVEPGTGHVLAMSTNRRFGYDAADPAQESFNLHTAASKGAGSTYKVFVATAALERGIPPTHRITTAEPYTSRVYRNGVTEPYVVENYGDRMPADLSMHEALVRSSNTYFVALEDELGSVEGPVRAAQRLGLTSLDPVADTVIAQQRGSFTLGPEATSPLALANAYATLAAGGTRCDPVPVVEVLDRDGRPLTRDDGNPVVPGPSCTPGAVAPEVASTVVQMLVGGSTAPYGTGRRAAIPGHEVATKSGTAQDRFSVAFVGSTPRYTASVMLFDPTSNVDVGGFGGGFGGQIWHDAFLPVLSAEQPVPFPPAGLPLEPLPGG